MVLGPRDGHARGIPVEQHAAGALAERLTGHGELPVVLARSEDRRRQRARHVLEGTQHLAFALVSHDERERAEALLCERRREVSSGRLRERRARGRRGSHRAARTDRRGRRPLVDAAAVGIGHPSGERRKRGRDADRSGERIDQAIAVRARRHERETRLRAELPAALQHRVREPLAELDRPRRGTLRRHEHGIDAAEFAVEGNRIRARRGRVGQRAPARPARARRTLLCCRWASAPSSPMRRVGR